MNTNDIVKAVSAMDKRGLSIPFPWLKKIKTAAGKPDLTGIFILSDILYWYNWFEERNPQTGEFIRFIPKFKGPVLEKSYSDYERFFDFTESQVRRAAGRLEKMGLIKRVFRKSPTGTFIGWIPNPDNIRLILFGEKEIQGNLEGYTDKEEKKKVDYSGAPARIIAHLNGLIVKNYKLNGESHVKLIKALLKQSYTEADIIKAIDNMVAVWGPYEEWKGYLRPSTLFNLNKFDNYLNWTVPKAKIRENNLFNDLS